MLYRKELLLHACLFFCVSLSAQQYPFVHYTPIDGLVNSRVRSAYQDSKGRMYFITYGGLSVFDGARFKNYTTQNGLLVDMVNDVVEIGDDSLLVAVNTRGLNILVHGEMRPLQVGKELYPVINRLLKSNDGSIYATTDEGLYKLGLTKFEKLPINIPGQTIPSSILGPIIEYRDFLIFTTYDSRKNYGPFLYNKKTGTIADHLADMAVYCLETGPGGSIWLSTTTTTMMLDTLALAKGKLELIKPRLVPTGLVSLQGGIIHFNNQQELLLSSSNNQIIRYRKDGTVQHIVLPELSTHFVQNFFIDREDVLWICHDGKGVYKLPGTKFQPVLYPFNDNSSGIRTISGITADAWWVVMNNGELIRQTFSGNKSFRATPSFDAYFLHTGKKYFYASDTRSLFMARSPTANETVVQFRKIMVLPDTAIFGGIVVGDKNGNIILFETRNLCVIQDDKLLFTYPLKPFDLVEGMHLDKHNRLWVINRYSGLMIFSLHPESPETYLKKELHFTKEFEDGSPRSMVVDGNEVLWVGSRYKGLTGFTVDTGGLKKTWHFQTQDGLTDNFITALTCDKDNNIIIGTQTGLDRLIKTQEGYRLENITKSSNTFSYINYVWMDAANNAFAWTKTSDILQVEPATTVSNRIAPELLLAEIKINGKKGVGLRSPFRLDHHQRNITFSVAAPSFIDEKQIKYSYLLSGDGNKDWSDTTSTADISLLNLSPGKYTLHVKAFFPSTSYTPKETEFVFTILPPWWQTWWFRIGVGLLGIGILITGIRIYYRRKLEKQKTILEKQQAVEKERTRIATDMHDDLGAGLSKIRFLSETVQRNIHEEAHQPHLQNIADSSVELVDKFNEIIWAMNEKNNSLEDLLYYMRNYTAKYCEENNLAYTIKIPDQVPPLIINGEMRRHIFLTIKEGLHNVVKHAGAKKVHLEVQLDPSITISIRDDGKGFDATIMSNAGNGLRNMEHRMKNVNGQLLINNDAGTLLTIIVPFPVT